MNLQYVNTSWSITHVTCLRNFIQDPESFVLIPGILIRSAVWIHGDIPEGTAQDFAHVFCAVTSVCLTSIEIFNSIIIMLNLKLLHVFVLL